MINELDRIFKVPDMIDGFTFPCPICGSDPEAIKQSLLQLIKEEKIKELQLIGVGKVVNPKQKASVTYMSGFGYARNNLQEYKSDRIKELKESK